MPFTQICYAAFNRRIADELIYKTKPQNHGPASRAFTPSPEQAVIFGWIARGQGHAVVEAVAGSGKTTTIVQGLKHMGDSRMLNINTFNSLGWQSWLKVQPTTKLDGFGPRSAGFRKFTRIWSDMSRAYDWKPEYRCMHGFVRRLWTHARQSGLGVKDGPQVDVIGSWTAVVDQFELRTLLLNDKRNAGLANADVALDVDVLTGCRLAFKVLMHGKSMGMGQYPGVDFPVCDFDDQLWMPLVMDAPVPQYDWFLTDECQDSNALRRLFAQRSLKSGGRAIFVGDPYQSCYAFSGADSESMAHIKTMFNAITLPLSVSYRCPQAVVRSAQADVPHIQYHESAVEGSVTEIDYDELMAMALVPGQDAVVCRNTAPLVKMFVTLVKRGGNLPIKIEGKANMGAGMLALVKTVESDRKSGTTRKGMTVAEFSTKLAVWAEAEYTRLNALGEKGEEELALLDDTMGCVMAIVDGIMDRDGDKDLVFRVRSEIIAMFGGGEDEIAANSGGGDKRDYVVLSTIHRAKGLEWARVFFLGPELIPSKYAKTPSAAAQERNLRYVAKTRAQRDLIMVPLPVEDED